VVNKAIALKSILHLGLPNC